jgi:hypothetical protein
MNTRQRGEVALRKWTSGSIGAKLGRSFNVTPAKAGVQRLSRTLAVESLDPRFRGDDKAVVAWGAKSTPTGSSRAMTVCEQRAAFND